MFTICILPDKINIRECDVLRIHFVRHGETPYNKDSRFQGQSNLPLNETGQIQAEKLGQKFEYLSIDNDLAITDIYSSPLSRTMETAEQIAKKVHITPKTDSAIKEIGLGEFEGKTAKEVLVNYKDPDGVPILTKWKEDPLKYDIPNGEKVSDVDLRVKTFVDNIIKTHKPEDNIVIVTHGGPISVVLCHVLKTSLRESAKMKIDNASVTVIEAGKDLDSSKLICANDTSHLDGFLSPYIKQ